MDIFFLLKKQLLNHKKIEVTIALLIWSIKINFLVFVWLATINLPDNFQSNGSISDTSLIFSSNCLRYFRAWWWSRDIQRYVRIIKIESKHPSFKKQLNTCSIFENLLNNYSLKSLCRENSWFFFIRKRSLKNFKVFFCVSSRKSATKI